MRWDGSGVLCIRWGKLEQHWLGMEEGKTHLTFVIVIVILQKIPGRKSSQLVSWKRGELGTTNQFKKKYFWPDLLAAAGY